jgi:drug/metabolite transporter (DMT)-like permease
MSPTSRAPNRPWRQELALVGITAIWGSTFLIVHLAVQTAGPFFFVGIRFLIAGAASAIVFHRALPGMRGKDVGAGAAIGTMIFLGYGLQTYGLKTIDASTSAFITALYVPLVPLVQWAVFRKAPRAMAFVGAGLAFAGMILLAGPGSLGDDVHGELATVIGTVPIAGEIVLIGFFAGKVHLGRVTVVQLLTTGVLGMIVSPIMGEGLPPLRWGWMLAAAGLGVASALIQLTMNWAQRSVTPTRATVIYAMEPVWAGVVGSVAGEAMTPPALVGAAMILGGILISELRPASRKSAETDTDTDTELAPGATPISLGDNPPVPTAPTPTRPPRGDRGT